MLRLSDLEVVALARHLLEDRVDDAAGTAPGRPEVDEHGLAGLEDLGLEVAVGHVGSLPVTVLSPCCLRVLGIRDCQYYTK